MKFIYLKSTHQELQTTKISLVATTHSRLMGDLEFESRIDVFSKELQNKIYCDHKIMYNFFYI